MHNIYMLAMVIYTAVLYRVARSTRAQSASSYILDGLDAIIAKASNPELYRSTMGEQPGIQEEQRFASHHDIRNDSVGLAGLAKAAAAVIPLHVNIEVVVANKLGGADCAGDRLLSCAYHAREDINGAL